MINKKYRADYYYKKKGAPGRGVRTQITGSSSGHLKGASTESAVINYLRSRHPGHDIELMTLEWR